MYLTNPAIATPRYAGVLYGITNFISTVPGILAPIVIGALTPNVSSVHHRDGRFGSKVGQIGPKWDKSGAFSISVHLARRPTDLLWSQTHYPCPSSGKVGAHSRNL